jgi:hypothetical protein
MSGYETYMVVSDLLFPIKLVALGVLLLWFLYKIEDDDDDLKPV